MCGDPEKNHPGSATRTGACAVYRPIDPTPHDPDGHAETWREAAHREGITLGQFCKRLLDAHIKA